jgi:hypothetical protein
MLNLKDFVANALAQIMDGVQTAQEHAAEIGAMVSSNNTLLVVKEGQPMIEWNEDGFGKIRRYGQYIDFDVAVTTTDTAKGKMGAGLFVASISLGAQVEGEIQNATISKISFSIPVFLREQTNE